MSTLPSFEDLVASLGLPKDPELTYGRPEKPHRSSRSHNRSTSSLTSHSSRTSSCCSFNISNDCKTISPAIIVSSTDIIPPISSTNPRVPRLEKSRSVGRLRGSRYSPYLSENPHARRPSLPTLLNELCLSPTSTRARSITPPLNTPRSLHENVDSAIYSKLKSRNIGVYFTHSASTPISSFVRRRTPQTSPTASPSTQSRRRVSIPSVTISPVVLPTVPRVATLLSPMGDREPSVRGTLANDYQISSSRRNRQIGLRISAYIPHTQGRHGPSVPTIST